MAAAPPQLLRQLSLLARENAITAQEKAQGKEYIIAGWSGSVDDLLRTVRDCGSAVGVGSSSPLLARQASWGGSDAGSAATRESLPSVGARGGSSVPAAAPAALIRQRSPEVVTEGLLPWLAVQRLQQQGRSGIDAERRLFMQCNLEMRVLPGTHGGDRAVLTGLDTVGGWHGRERMEGGEEHDMIVSSRRGVGYRYVKTLHDAIYGRVEMRVECARCDGGAFVGMRTHVWRDTPTLVALKIMDKEGVLRRRARGASAPSQEDALNEMAGLLYLQSSSTCKYVSTIIELIDTGATLVKVRRRLSLFSFLFFSFFSFSFLFCLVKVRRRLSAARCARCCVVGPVGAGRWRRLQPRRVELDSLPCALMRRARHCSMCSPHTALAPTPTLGRLLRSLSRARDRRVHRLCVGRSLRSSRRTV